MTLITYVDNTILLQLSYIIFAESFTTLTNMDPAIRAVLKEEQQPICFNLFIIDAIVSHVSLLKVTLP